jgi:CHAT domain-containing protein
VLPRNAEVWRKLIVKVSREADAIHRRRTREKTFKTLAPTYETFHLATHGVIDNRQPLYSHLLLTKTEGDPENDGLVEAREIMNMDLHADLAVLSGKK